jgi:hypothetical protein
MAQTKTILAGGSIKSTPRNEDGSLHHENSAELHAINRLRQRYGKRYGITASNATEVVFEHLAMLLAGETKHLCTHGGGTHRGNEVHRIYWGGFTFVVAYDPRIKRIVTYLPSLNYRAYGKRLYRGMETGDGDAD